MEKFKNNEHITGKFKQRVKGGMIVEHIDTVSTFCQGHKSFRALQRKGRSQHLWVNLKNLHNKDG